MNRYGASSRHYDFDSASNTGRNYSPRNGGPPRNFGRPLRGHPAHRGPTLGRGAHPDPYTSDDDSDFGPCGHHHHHHGHSGGVHGADDIYGSDDDSEFEVRGHRHGHGHAGAGGMSRDGPRIVNRANGAAHSSDPHTHFGGGDYSSSDDSECEHHGPVRGGPAGTHRRRPEMRFDTDSSDDRGANLLSRGPAGRRSTATHAPPRGRATRDGSDGAELDRHMAAARRARGATGASRGGMMAPTSSRAPRNGRVAGDRRGAVAGGRP